MIDLVQLQNDLHGLLLSAPALNSVNIVLERKFLVQSEVELDAIWSTVRNGRSGNGLLIEMPRAKVNSPSIQDMPQDITLGVVAFQNGDAAFTPETGSGHFAENLAQLALSILHLQAIIGVGQLQGVGHEPARDYEFINAERATLRISGVRTPATPRCAAVQYTLDTGMVTLACATTGAKIFYTTDGSTPISPTLEDSLGRIVNPQAHLYTAPFAVNSGDRVRAVAQAFAYNASEILNKPIA